MAHRKEVFQLKVLQKLYPAIPKQKKEPTPPCIVDASATKHNVKRKTCPGDAVGGDAGQTHSKAKPARRMYTVLPPPEDYVRQSEKSITLPTLENRQDVAKDPSEEIVPTNEELNQDEEEGEVQKRKRRRKCRSTLHQDSAQDGAAPVSGSSTGQRAPVEEGAERISRNRKRKLKKKRHKEKLLSMGLMPRASALEFTYQKDGEMEEGQEENERRVAEVSDFLRTTLEIYTSDSSVHVDAHPLISNTVENLLSDVSRGCKPASVLQQLCSLKDYVQQKETEKLDKALKGLHGNPFMSEEEASAVNSLFQYWIRDVLPMQGDKAARLSLTHS